MTSRARLGAVLAVALALLATVALPHPGIAPPPAAAAGTQSPEPGRVFLTGHPADHTAREEYHYRHAGPSHPKHDYCFPISGRTDCDPFYENPTGARKIVKEAVSFVTKRNPAPRFLLVGRSIYAGSRSTDGKPDPILGGWAQSGFHPCPPGGRTPAGGCYETAHICYSSWDRESPCPKDVNDLRTVDFGAYDAIVLPSDSASDFNERHMEILVARQCQLYSYVNAGGGLLAFANGGIDGGPTDEYYDWVIRKPFAYFPFLRSHKIDRSVATHNWHMDGRLTEEGKVLLPGLGDEDVNDNDRHNYFVIDRSDTHNLEDDKFVAVDTMEWPQTGRPPDRPPGSSGNEPVDISVASDQRLRECPYSIGISAEPVKHLEGDAGTTKEFKFRISAVWHDSTNPVTVRYAMEEGSATRGDDDLEPLAPGSVTLTPAETKKEVVVVVNGDAKEEPDEAFSLRLSLGPSAPTGAQIDTPWVTGTIVNDDGPTIAPTASPLPVPDDERLDGPGGDTEEPKRAAAPVAPGTPSPPPPGEIPGLGPGNTQAPGSTQGPGPVPNPNVPPAPSAAAQPVTAANAAAQPQALAQAQPAMMVERQRQLQLQTEQAGRGRTALAAAEGDRLDPTLALAGAWALTMVGGAVLFGPRRRPDPVWARATTGRLGPRSRR